MALVVEEPVPVKVLPGASPAAPEWPNPEPSKPAARLGRPPVARERKAALQKIRAGANSVDKPWLLKQLLVIYSDKGFRAQDRLRALELMARISGYTGREAATDEDEAKAINDIMRDMEKDAGPK